MSTPPHVYTDPAWAAREARRQALEEAAAECERLANIGREAGEYYEPGVCDDCADAIRALAAREP